METANSPDEESAFIDSNISSPQTLKSHTRDVHILSSAFLLVFLAYGAVQNLQSTVNTVGDLGTISLGILYVSFTIFSLISSLVVRKMGSKKALILGTTGYWLFTAANLKPNWYTMVPASAYLGFCSSIIWVGQGTYLTAAARSHSSDCKLHEGTVIGIFNGEFWGMFACHQVVGNLIALFVLGDDSAGGTSGTTILFAVFLCIMTVGTTIMFFLHPRGGEADKGAKYSFSSFFSSVASAAKSVRSPLSDVRMLLIIPLFAYSGLQQAFVWAEFTKAIVKPALGESGVGGSMAVYGAFDAVCSVVAGRLTSGLPSITNVVIFGSFTQAVILLWILLGYSTTSGVLGVVYPLLMAAALGVGDGVLNTQINALLGMLFGHDMEGAFAQLKLWQSGSIAVVFFLVPYISVQAMALMMLLVLGVSVAGFLVLTLRVDRAFSDSSSDS